MRTSSGCRVTAAGKFLRLGEAKFVVRGITYGPFPPGADGSPFPAGEVLRADLEQIASLGMNVIRVYHVPSADVLSACAGAGLRLLVTVPWAQHVDFLGDAALRASAMEAVREAVRRCRDSEVMLGYFVANEIESTLVRWMGPSRVQRFIERLIFAGRSEDPGALFAYPNYPSTEYLHPGNADFTAFNVYLEDSVRFRSYLARLQNLSGGKPLVISEFGLDVRSHGERGQAEAMDWHWRESAGAGLAGSVWFSFTDEWHRGNETVRDWEFGVTTGARKERLACETARRWLRKGGLLDGFLAEGPAPKISVIICTYNGSRGLRACLESMHKLRYPDFEILVIDDGSEEDIAEIVRGFGSVRYLRQEHAGLSAARNRGAVEARGDILAYTDDDCVVDEDWLSYLARSLGGDGFAAAGGPNIPPPPENLVQACVAAAPGGPSEVLLTDAEAEHIPGCNLAVRRDAFGKVGGFLPEYHAAGDDVDFCWRLQEMGLRIGFSPAAQVWHVRRSRVRDYLSQQWGYGKAEALLMRRHGARFGLVGGAHWRGVVYQGGLSGLIAGGPLIYQGVFGYAGFQRIYSDPALEYGYIASSPHWLALALLFLAASPWFPVALVPGVILLGVQLARAWRVARSAEIAPEFDGHKARFCLWLLAWAQPLVRGWARYVGGLRCARAPRALPRLGEISFWPRRRWVRWNVRDAFWNSQGVTRDALFEPLRKEMLRKGWLSSAGHGWENWDVEFDGTLGLWSIRLISVTEYHDAQGRLTRVRLRLVPTSLLTLLNNLILAGVLACGALWGLHLFLSGVGGYLAFLVFSLGWGLFELSRVRSGVRKIARETGVDA